MVKTIDIEEWFGLTFAALNIEWRSGQYGKLSDCPFYDECETYRKAMNYLIDANYMPKDAEGMKIDALENLIKE